MRLRLWVIIFSIAFANLIYAEDLSTIEEIHMAGKRIALDNPIILQDNTPMAAIQDFLPLLNAKLTYLPKDDIYELQIPTLNLDCVLVPNSKEFWVGTKVHFFSKKNMVHQNLLYVSIGDFLQLLGAEYQQEGTKLFVKLSPQSTPKKEDKSILFQTEPGRNTIPDLAERLPTFEEDREQFLTFGTQIYRLDSRFIYINNILYLDLTFILRNEKFSVEQQGNDLAISRGYRKCKFSFTEKKVYIADLDLTLQSIGPIIKQNNHTYIPLISFVTAFDLGFSWDSYTRTLTILNQIKSVQFTKKAGQIAMNINLAQPIKDFKSDTLEWPKRLSITIPFTSVMLNKRFYNMENLHFNDLLINQDGLSTHIELGCKFPISYSTKLTSTGFEVLFHTAVYSLSQTQQGEKTIIKIKSSVPIEYKSFIPETGSKIVVDIPNTFCELPPSIDVKSTIVSQIRTSQFQLSPLITRIVFDLTTSNVKYEIKRASDSSLDVELTGVGNGIKIEAPPRMIPTPIIVLDPGHGGLDPGAPCTDATSEKDLTLDIALHLKTLLEKSGRQVILTRTKDELVSLPRRVEIANKAKASLFISIHLNSFERAYANGLETYYYKAEDKALAQILHKELLKSFHLRNNGLREARMYVNRYAEMPTVLVEPLYLSNPTECSLILDPEYRKKIAESLFRGINRYLAK